MKMVHLLQESPAYQIVFSCGLALIAGASTYILIIGSIRYRHSGWRQASRLSAICILVVIAMIAWLYHMFQP